MPLATLWRDPVVSQVARRTAVTSDRAIRQALPKSNLLGRAPVPEPSEHRETADAAWSARIAQARALDCSAETTPAWMHLSPTMQSGGHRPPRGPSQEKSHSL